MSNNLNSPQYPFDPTGSATTNLVQNELQPLTGVGDRDFYFIIPQATPFFADSMTLAFKSTSGEIVQLQEGVDYYFTHYFLGASRATAKPIYGSITFLNTSLRGTLIINPYQTLGGDWTVDTQTTAAILAQTAVNPRTTTWDQVANYPSIFPPIPHEWNLIDLAGASKLIDSINQVCDAILTQASSAMTQHINDKSSNPHGITPGMIGAVSQSELQGAVNNAVQQATGSTDKLQEGTKNLWFTEGRVLQTKLAGFVTQPSAAPLGETDQLLDALVKIQGQLNAANTLLAKKAESNRPAFSGLGSQNLIKIEMTSSISIDITQAEAYQILIRGNGSIAFDTGRLGDMTNKVIEFSITTINDGTSNAYAIAFPTNVKWVDGSMPPRTTTANAKDSWYFWSEDGGATWTGSLSNKNPN